MDLYLGEVIGVSIVLLLALFVAIKVFVEELKEEIEYIKTRNRWRKRNW
jgi:hypothetical protein